MYAEHFAEKIKAARLKAGYTQKQVSEATGIAQNVICRLETGKRQPDLENLGILIDFYEVSADWVLGTGITKK